MGDNSKIIVVANQKGGVGKSTVCMSLAAYLASVLKFGAVTVIDTDFQQSIVKRRAADIELIKGSDRYPTYNVTSFNLENYSSIPKLIDELRKFDGYYIFDTPGLLKHQGIVSLLALADYIIIPFNYDALELSATTQFVIFWNNLKDKIIADGGQVNTKLFFLPMKRDLRMGTKVEKELWQAASSEFAKLGIVTSHIKYCKEVKLCDSISLRPSQVDLVRDCFTDILEGIYGTNEKSEEDGSKQEYPES